MVARQNLTHDYGINLDHFPGHVFLINHSILTSINCSVMGVEFILNFF